MLVGTFWFGLVWFGGVGCDGGLFLFWEFVGEVLVAMILLRYARLMIR